MTRGILALLLFIVATAAAAATDSGQSKPTDIVMLLGTKDEDRVFTPSKQTFEAGKAYRLVLINITSEKHFFSAPDFTAAISSRKLEFKGDAAKDPAGAIEVGSGGRAAWAFVPVRAGSYPLECTSPGHAKDGMTAILEIK